MMINRKVTMKSIDVLLLQAALIDISAFFNTSIEKDMAYVMSRIKHEKLSFLGITLPSFAKDFERSLELGYVSPELFRSFRKLRRSPLIPRFLSGITAHVFDNSGVVRADASIEAIDGIRQVCLMFNKPKMECTDDRKAKAIRSFLSCERDLRSIRPKSWRRLNDFVRISRMCFGRSLSELGCKAEQGMLLPRHGPGAVGEGLQGNAKFVFPEWSRRLERSFPEDMYAVPNWNHLSATRKWNVGASSKNDVKVVFVPKTLKTPRVIAIEPTNTQYCQQALASELVQRLENDHLTRGRINFSTSDHNRELARQSSKDRAFATLDMSEASDRVHAGLVYYMLSSNSSARDAAFACRTKYASLPNGMRIPLVKFASMGSALCFPIESMYHYVLCILGALEAESLRCNYRNVRRVSRSITVFGDDLIVPSTWRVYVENVLGEAGCVVNRKKSFSNGYFRESCGLDAYKGSIVTPVYIRTQAPTRRSDADRLVSYTASANLFYKKGFWTVARTMREYVESITGPLPHYRDNISALGWYSFTGAYSIERWNAHLMRFETRGLVPKAPTYKDPIDGASRLLKFFLTRGEDPVGIENEESVRRFSLALRQRWIVPC